MRVTALLPPPPTPITWAAQRHRKIKHPFGRLGSDTAGEKRIVKPCLDFARRRIRHDNSPCPIRSGETTSVLCSRRPSRNEWRAVSPARRVANERRAGRSVDVFHLHIRRRGESERLCPGEEDPGQGRQQALPQARHLSRQTALHEASDLRFGSGLLGSYRQEATVRGVTFFTTR